MSKIQLLDCTLRDGAHLNKGMFGERMIRDTIADLVKAKVDIVEVGFFDNNPNNINSSFFDSISAVRRVLPEDHGSSMFSLMADFVDVSAIEPYDGTIDIFRLSFKRHRLEWALNAARILMDKGYKVYINPVNCNVYSDKQYLEVIEKVNELKPYGFSIVDTFGVLRLSDFAHFYYLVENNLNPDIVIGAHLHENLGLAYSLAQHFLSIRNPKRSISIDGSLLGMGRVPGNLCLEQIMDHMNINFGTDYDTEPALDCIDDYIAPIKREIPWGYSIPYALSGKFGVHRTYAEYLMGKNRLKTKDIQRLLSSIDKDHVEMFDEAYVESLYRNYLLQQYDDAEDIKWLGDTIRDKKVFVVCPGGSISKEKAKVTEYITGENVVTISVNFIPDFAGVDYVFCANKKRLGNLMPFSNIPRLITSNLLEEVGDAYEHAFSYNNCVYFNEIFCEDSTLMLMKILQSAGCKELAIAGFDGFAGSEHPYYLENYTKEAGKTIDIKKVTGILQTTLGNMQINFITRSNYDCPTRNDK